MSVREFAAHLGVSDRMVSKWEAGADAIRPRPMNQAALDTSLALASQEVKSRFNHIAHGGDPTAPRPRRPSGSKSMLDNASHVVRHPLDGKLMTLVDAGPFRPVASRKSVWLSGYFIDVYPTTNADYARFLAATGHRAPAHWPEGSYTIADDPEALHHDPISNVSWEDACAYAMWASKWIPSAYEWDRAARGGEGMTVADMWEWVRAETGPGRRGPKGAETGGFRCCSPVAELLELLAI
jgi:formylglycine-generating enzyme required for sulfatase activity